MQSNIRDITYQPFSTFVLPVLTTPTQIFPQQGKTDLIDSFVVSLDAGAANNVFIGDQAVTINTGLEIVAGGGPVNFKIDNQNMHYEIMSYLEQITVMIGCRLPNTIKTIPFVLWDLAQIYIIAPANTNVRIAAFRSQFI